MRKFKFIHLLLILAGIALVDCSDRGLEGHKEQKPQGLYYLSEDCMCEWITPFGRFGNNFSEALDSLIVRDAMFLSTDCPNGYSVRWEPVEVWEWTKDSRTFSWPIFIDDKGGFAFQQSIIFDEYGYAYYLHTCPD